MPDTLRKAYLALAEIGGEAHPNAVAAKTGRTRGFENVNLNRLCALGYVQKVRRKREVRNKKPGRIMFCSMCDPYQPIERKLGLARKVLEILVDSECHILIMTKSDLVMRDYYLLDGRGNVEVGFTITSLNDLPEWEPKAPGNTRRIEALKKAHDLGIKTFVSMEPTIPEETRPMEIMEALNLGVDRWIIGALNYMDVDPNFYRREVPKWAEYVHKKSLDVKWKKELKPYLERKAI